MSSLPPRVSQLLKNNKEFVKTWAQPPTMEQIRASAKANHTGLLVLTCLDPRCIAEEFLGPNLQAGVIRNAGGRATPDAVRSILALRSLIAAESVMVVHHTDCGMTHLTDAGIVAEAKERTPEAAADIDKIDFGCFTPHHFVDTIKEDVLWLRDQKPLAGLNIYGFEMDTFTGDVKLVDV